VRNKIMGKSRPPRSRLACDPQQYQYVDVAEPDGGGPFPSYADVVRVIERDRRLAPDGYRVVVEKPPEQQQQRASAINGVVMKLICEVRELDTFVRCSIAELKECGKKMNSRCQATECELAQIKEALRCIQLVEVTERPQPAPVQQYPPQQPAPVQQYQPQYATPQPAPVQQYPPPQYAKPQPEPLPNPYEVPTGVPDRPNPYEVPTADIVQPTSGYQDPRQNYAPVWRQ
jgi:hypothetical protein